MTNRTAAGIPTDIRSRIRMFENCDQQTSSASASSTSTSSAPIDIVDGLASGDFKNHSRIEVDELGNGCDIKEKLATMMMPTPPPPPPPGVQTDANGLILPKKLINPCLTSTDRKQLHRELKFNTKMALRIFTWIPSPTYGLKSELNRVIMERAQKHAQARLQNQENNDDDKQYVNPEYLNARAKLRAGQRTELK
ncbi:protein FAM107B-like [Musca vetustissima]|uniref:protein FAM107B-like n=1 Tax=Musca vetustissima TaxID=27455 RepID=UPI002AB6BB1D|nr:protein FAM107B-like [Musca vetustissima]